MRELTLEERWYADEAIQAAADPQNIKPSLRVPALEDLNDTDQENTLYDVFYHVFGIWSMHCIAMLAIRLPAPMGYHWPTVMVFLVAASLASAVAP